MTATPTAHCNGPAVPSFPRRPLSARERARIARQTAVVHQASVPVHRQDRVGYALLDGPYDALALERAEIRGELAAAGLL